MTSKQRDILFNVVFWTLYFLYQWAGLAALYGGYSAYFVNACLALPIALGFSMTIVRVLIPRFLQRKKVLQFWILLTALTLILLILRRFFNYYVVYPRVFPFALQMPLLSPAKLIVELFDLYTITGLYSLYSFIRLWYEERARAQELLRHQAQAELDLLRAQVQPHFIFNSLNNIYSSSIDTSPETARLVEHLSGYLSYGLYDAARRTVPLVDELANLDHYLQLQKNRYGPRLDVAINRLNDLSSVSIVPMLLLPLVENCIKHGVETARGNSWIRIDAAQEQGSLTLMIENSKDEGPAEGAAPGGIGIANVRRRLELAYAGAQEFRTVDGTNSFLVIIKIGKEGLCSVV